MNQIQSIRALSAGLISLKVAQMSADHMSGEMRLAPESGAARWQHRQQHGKEQTDENREHSVADQADDKTGTVEGGQLGEVGFSQGGHGGCSQQVNRIPDAAVRNDTVDAGNNRHRDPANNSALDARRVGMDLRRNTNTVAGHPGLELLRRREEPV